MNSGLIALLRVLTWLEGGSYLLLLFVAMPLKYVWGVSMATKIAGGVHGILFLGTLLLLAASLVPGSLWWLDRQIQRT
jgi:hypothetical protein